MVGVWLSGSVVAMREIFDGVFHWKARHPKIGIDVDCHFVAGSGTVIDPLLPEEGIGWFNEHRPQRIVLSTRHHLRHAPELAKRFNCPILCHESGLYEFEEGPAVDGFAFGDRLADDVVAVEMDSISPDDTVLRIEAGEGALLFADSVIHYGSLGFVPDNFIGDDPEGVKAKVRQRCSALLDEDFTHLLFAHGEPLLDGREALGAFAAGS
jgi:glyoxylase-like metal-dependent hydrolase (beta-lactamase superfamily II)